MLLNSNSEPVSKSRLWAGAIIIALTATFLIFDGVAKLIQTDAVVKASVQLGFPVNSIAPIGLILLICTAIYLVPRTRILGAILLTGYLGGAIATHVRAGNEAFPIIFTSVFGLLVWGGLVLREPRLVGLITMRHWPGESEANSTLLEERMAA